MPSVEKFDVYEIKPESLFCNFYYKVTLSSTLYSNCKLDHGSKILIEREGFNLWLIKRNSENKLTKLLYLRLLDINGYYRDKTEIKSPIKFMQEKWGSLSKEDCL